MKLGDPQNKSASSITPDDLKLAARELPPSPKVFGKLGKLLRNPNTSLTDITDLVHTDASLTTRVLRLSNSAAFAQDQAIDTLDDAINRVGFREVFKLVGMAAVSDLFSSRNNTYRIDSSTLWENALSCGLAMESIAQKIGRDEQEYYTLGLLRSMGKTVIDICAQKESESCRYPIASRPPLLQWEQETFGITNPAVAGFLLSTWNFSPETVSAIQSQYGTNPSSPKNEAAIVLNLAGSLAELGRPLHGESEYWISFEEHSEELGLTAEDIEETLDSVKNRLEAILTSVED
jgi:HD-like signal output (HDOD) protein